MADESQRRGELPASAAAVAVGDDAPVGLELQALQQVRHHLEEGKERIQEVNQCKKTSTITAEWEATLIQL